MNKPQIINNYMQTIFKKVDDLRAIYPKATSRDIVEMEKGFRHCAQKSAEWLEEFLGFIAALEVDPATNGPLPSVIDQNINHTNEISSNPSNIVKKKKSFLQVASEAAKDMGTDFCNANQGGLGGVKKP